MAGDQGDSESGSSVGHSDVLKDKIKDVSQKVSEASKLAVKKTGEFGNTIADSDIAKDIVSSARHVGDEVKQLPYKFSNTVEKKREEIKQKVVEKKVAKAKEDDVREKELVDAMKDSPLISPESLSKSINSDDLVTLSRDEYEYLVSRSRSPSSLNQSQTNISDGSI